MGIIYALSAAVCWAVANVCFQLFHTEFGVSAFWFNSVRLIFASIILIVIAFFTQKKDALKVFKNRADTIRLIIYALSIVIMQTTFYYAISISNAGTATTLQYVNPAMILAFMCLKELRLPKVVELIAVLSAIFGIFAIVTHLDFAHIYITTEVLLWGLGAAAGMAFYTVCPSSLLKKYNTVSITAFAMIIAMVEYNIIIAPWNYAPEEITFTMLVLICGITCISSIIPFITFNLGIKKIGAFKASIICALEPVLSTVFAVAAGTVLSGWDIVGLIAIIIAVILSAKK